MKTKKVINNTNFIDLLINKEELSYEDYTKLKKLENLYIKAKNKYENKKAKTEKKNNSQLLDSIDKIVDYTMDNCFDNNINQNSRNRILEYKEYMDSFSKW